jgi:hypothetical protein
MSAQLGRFQLGGQLGKTACPINGVPLRENPIGHGRPIRGVSIGAALGHRATKWARGARPLTGRELL